MGLLPAPCRVHAASPTSQDKDWGQQRTTGGGGIAHLQTMSLETWMRTRRRSLMSHLSQRPATGQALLSPRSYQACSQALSAVPQH